MNFGKNLHFLRKMTSMTQEELAEKLNVTRQTVSKWELDQGYPELDKLLELCGLFNCSVDQILREDMIYSNEAYSDIKLVTVEPFRYIQYAVISGEPEEDAIFHVERWAQKLKLKEPKIIGWNFPYVSQEQNNVYHMHGYSAALVLDEGRDIGDIDSEIFVQEKQKYVTITLKYSDDEAFSIIPNAYKVLMTHMAANGLKERFSPSVISCFEHEYFVGEDKCMDIFIAVE